MQNLYMTKFPLHMPIATQQQILEQTLSNTLIYNAIFSGIIIIILPLLRRIFPTVFAPQSHLYRRNTGYVGYIFWFVDVFQQPLSVFATRGNIATMFTVFQLMLFGTYFILALISITVLIPVYYSGQDMSKTTNYLTFWSKITISHLESNSVMIIVPILITITFTYVIMQFYKQFIIIYIFFRQRCMKRVLAQNYVVQLQNIPSRVQTKKQLLKVLSTIKYGIKAFIPIPKETTQLTKLHEQVIDMQVQLNSMKRKMQSNRVKYESERAVLTALVEKYQDSTVKKDKAKHQKYLKILGSLVSKYVQKSQKEMMQFGQSVVNIRVSYFKILQIAFENSIDYKYLYHMQNNPPLMPSIVQPIFDFLPDNDNKIFNILYERNESMKKFTLYELNKSIQAQISNKDTEKDEDDEPIGKSVFFVCETQTVAAEKYTSLISLNQNEYKASLACNPEEIIWRNLIISDTTRFIRTLVCFILFFVLFVIYIYGIAYLNGIISKNSDKWSLFFFKVCPSYCVYGVNQVKINCMVCSSATSMLSTFIPSLINALYMGLLPLFINLLIKLLSFSSITQNNDVMFNILYIFLIVLMGLTQIAFQPIYDQQSGLPDLSLLQSINIFDIVQSIGNNVYQQQFTFLNYIINQYFTFPIFNLLNISGLITYFVLKIFMTSTLELNVRQRQQTMDYPKSLAYVSHMLTIGLIYAVVAPSVNIIIFVIYFMEVLVDRYYIIFVYNIDLTADMSNQMNLLVNVIGTIYIGLIFMLVSTCCYMLNQQGEIYTFGVVVIILCIIVSAISKSRVDQSFKRALLELSRGDDVDSTILYLNPQSLDSKLPSVLDFNNSDEKIRLLDILFKGKRRDSHEYIKYGDSIYLSSTGEKVKSMNAADKILRKIYIDMTNLPVSALRAKDEDKLCCVLDDPEQVKVKEICYQENGSFVFSQQEDVYMRRYKEFRKHEIKRTQDEVNMMASFTHPALLDVISAQQKDYEEK